MFEVQLCKFILGNGKTIWQLADDLNPYDKSYGVTYGIPIADEIEFSLKRNDSGELELTAKAPGTTESMTCAFVDYHGGPHMYFSFPTDGAVYYDLEFLKGSDYEKRALRNYN